MYFLIILSLAGLIFSFYGNLPFDPVNYIFSFAAILSVSLMSNYIFAKYFDAPTNVESVYISALILGLIITPPVSFDQMFFLFWASVLAMALKFIFTIRRKHIFNPVAIAVLITYLYIGNAASWWVGNLTLAPLVLIGTFLIARKLRRWDLVASFIFSTVVATAFYGILDGQNPFNFVWRALSHSPILFFAGIMITEPLTTPPTKIKRIIYGILVGILFTPQFNIAGFFTTPEMALVIGNVFSYLVSPKYKLLLTLKDKVKLTPDTYEFVFHLAEPLNFTPGQYMEFTFDHASPDSRGNRRYLSLASSPTENEVRLGVKFGDPPSSFKKNMLLMEAKNKIVASQLIGDFTLPKDPAKKLVLIAGGIGITPFRSMLKYLIDKSEKRDIVLVYTAGGEDQFVYKDVLEEANKKLGIKIILVNTNKDGRMDKDKLISKIPDYSDRTYYISGSHGVVTAFEDLIKSLKVPRTQIITDYFPGFA
jgi:ferredoxin-NADP reductase/Na+-translocating ferredoxin:NAD+ oxidoreductase RnfD subunit